MLRRGKHVFHAAVLDLHRIRPRDDIGRFVSVPTKFRVKGRAIPPLAKNIPSTSVGNGNRSQDRRSQQAVATTLADKFEQKCE
jgi:hypothetical protein